MASKLKIKVKTFPDGSCCAEIKELFKTTDQCEHLLNQMGFKQDMHERDYWRFSSSFATAFVIQEAHSYKNRVPENYLYQVSIYPHHHNNAKIR